MSSVRLSPRLRSAVPFVRPGDRIIDVGTDHAYLPIYLLQEDPTRTVLATDIRSGPLRMAREHLEKLGLTGRIALKQTDGLAGLESFLPDTILLFGMGGELMVRILAEAPFVRNERIRLVLQPMTHAEILRCFLGEQGFSILDETLTREGEKMYQTICAAYTGQITDYPVADAYLGPCNRRKGGALFELFRERLIGQKKKILDACRSSATPDPAEIKELEALVAALECEEQGHASTRTV